MALSCFLRSLSTTVFALLQETVGNSREALVFLRSVSPFWVSTDGCAVYIFPLAFLRFTVSRVSERLMRMQPNGLSDASV